jgi:hypothetical protein
MVIYDCKVFKCLGRGSDTQKLEVYLYLQYALIL